LKKNNKRKKSKSRKFGRPCRKTRNIMMPETGLHRRNKTEEEE
jgi:hypothetical protein